MIYLYIYLIIGVCLLTYTSISQAIRHADRFKSDIKEWLWWVTTVGCALLWPVLLGSAVYDIIKEIHKEGDLA